MISHVSASPAIRGFIFAAIVALPPLSQGADNNPLSPAFMSDSQRHYWSARVSKMESGEKVTQEGFMDYCSDLWSSNASGEKREMSIEELADHWASMESKNPLDPLYKNALWRRDHIKLMDQDHDGGVSQDEYLAHMRVHWEEATKLAGASTLTHDQTMELITNPLDPRWHRR